MRHFFILSTAILMVVLSACSSTEEQGRGLRPNPVTQGEPGPQTPPDERISGLLQEAKQQYDDGQYETAFRMAEQVEDLVIEHKFPIEDEAMAVNIQGFSLMQLGRIEDYYVETFGVQQGAITKFERVLKIRPEDFRGKLGVALAKFRRHADSVRKGEALGSGVVYLEGIREDFRRAYNSQGAEQGKALFQEASRKLTIFQGNRAKLLELGYIFRDPSTVELGVGSPQEADWLGTLREDESELAVFDLEAILDQAIAGETLNEDDRALFDNQAGRIAKSWRTVRKYWRQRALTDLQSSRDRLLQIRNEQIETYDTRIPNYFWVDRDLTFVFQALGAFFLDSGLERARMIAIARGVPGDELEVEAQHIYTDPDFDDWQKTESERNYKAALSFTKSFINSHLAFERMRRERQDDIELAESDNANPFMVDLVTRYRRTMDQLIAEERGVRMQMVLEAAVLCIDPLFQINDIQQANFWANELKSNDPDSPLHHFVRATAYFEGERWEDASLEYEAFMQHSSFVEDNNRRSIARKRIMQCENYIARSAGAGEDAGR